MIIMVACALILLWSTWGILCPSYNDGIVGKLIFIAMSLSALAVVSGAPPEKPLYVLVVCLAAYGVRDFVMRHARRFGIERRARFDPLHHRSRGSR